MDMSSIQPALPFRAAAAATGASLPTQVGELGGFGKALVDAITKLDQVQQDADNLSMQMASGEPVDLHDVMIAQDQASLTLDLAVQVRNKLVDSYHEVMRMQM
jgi:flagellar hook-basal body complex protein FliE